MHKRKTIDRGDFVLEPDLEMRLEEQGKTGQKLRGIRQKRQKKRAVFRKML